MRHDDPALIALDSRLTRALDFTARDLAANRASTLSKAQRERLRQRGQRTAWVKTAFAGFLLALGVFLLVTPYLLPNSNPPILSALCGGVIFLLIGLGMMVSVWWGWRNVRADLDEDAVASAAGRARLQIEEAGRSTIYRLHIGRVKFRVEKDMLLAFRQDTHYRVYFSPHSETILSAELITREEAAAEGEAERKRKRKSW